MGVKERHRDAQVVLDGIEPSFPVCKTGVVAVGPQDFLKLSIQKARPQGFEP